MRMGYPATITGSVLGRGSRGMPASGKKTKSGTGLVGFVVTRCKGVGISDHELRGFPMGGRY
ncbi:hypothetical protein F9C07_7439 [Aspergillus flavus]|uniref:Uncharacterized protein n=1 Tax=Aspergillus flavus (strain ATCC 200026 / FGSC A1120 / IAM 13836 / NRRL 3357 / JCM 12722 / SRRC 167) TaxID=332952 RepID=A0A7U2QVY7_ASPFN|nr:hypothetical protein F9C07_7439 [Aspergillus flavus]